MFYRASSLLSISSHVVMLFLPNCSRCVFLFNCSRHISYSSCSSWVSLSNCLSLVSLSNCLVSSNSALCSNSCWLGKRGFILFISGVSGQQPSTTPLPVCLLCVYVTSILYVTTHTPYIWESFNKYKIFFNQNNFFFRIFSINVNSALFGIDL